MLNQFIMAHSNNAKRGENARKWIKGKYTFLGRTWALPEFIKDQKFI